MMRIVFAFLAALWIGAASAQVGQSPAPARLMPAPSAGGCTEATNYLARKSGTTNNAALTTYICGLVTDGIFAKLDALYYFGNDTLANSKLNLVQNAYNIGTYLGVQTPGASGAGGFSSCCGDIADGGFNPSTAVSPKFVQNSASMFIWGNDATGQTSPIAGDGTGNSSYLYAFSSGCCAYYAINGGSFRAGAVSDGKGLLLATRSGSSSISEYKNGTLLDTSTDTSTAVPNANLLFGGASVSAPSEYIIGGFGSNLTSTDVTNLYNRTHTLLQAIAGYP